MYKADNLVQVKKSHFLTKDNKFALLPDHSDFGSKGYSVPKQLHRQFFYWHRVELLHGTTYRVQPAMQGLNGTAFTCFANLGDVDSRERALLILNALISGTY